MLHIHFGTGRLGLGLVAPFLRTPNSELFLMNRAVSSTNPTGGTALEPARRNELLQTNSRKVYLIGPAKNGTSPESANGLQEHVSYDSFMAFKEGEVESLTRSLLEQSAAKKDGVIVTASVLTRQNYAPVIEALNAICTAKDKGETAIGDVYLIACENMVTAHEVLTCEEFAHSVQDVTRCHTRCVHALVDRICVGMEEAQAWDEPAVMVRTEEYGALKLEHCPHTEALVRMLQGSKAEFSRHLAVEKDIKGWLLNGSHWLIALTAFRESGGDTRLRLNDFITSTENHELYSAEVVNEMRDGIEALLRSDAQYEPFVRDVDVSAYLDRAACSILERFKANDDTIMRILARFRAPSPDHVDTVQSFVDRFLHRIDQPIQAYQWKKGVPPKSATQGIFNLFRLQASGMYIDTAQMSNFNHAQAA